MQFRLIISFFFVVIAAAVYAQPDLRYDKDVLSKEFHKGRRDALRKLMPDSSVAVLFASPIRNRANDVNYLYHPDPNLYYLTGLTEPNAMLIIFKEDQEFDTLTGNEFIFIQPRNAFMESWTGKRLGVEGVKSLLGFKNVLLNNQFSDFKVDLTSFKKVYTLKIYDDMRDEYNDPGDLYSLVKTFREKTKPRGAADGKVNAKGNVDDFNLGQWMGVLREVKQPEELVLMRKAIDMTCDAHAELMRALEPGMAEYHAQAIIEYCFKKAGSEYPGYPSILGGGENSCILHYETNRKPLESKDMLVIDAGAEYHGYTADVTRTLPTDGKFSEEEKIIYNIVLEAQIEGIKACMKGNEFRAPHKAAVAVIQKRLVEHGIIKSPTEYMKYFFHGTSHYLGLDVHDAGTGQKLLPNSIITVEPGVYIPAGSDCDPRWWNIGVRIEDDILITDGAPENLSDCVPKTVEEVEKLMQEKSFFNHEHNNKDGQK
jgi:Xaa-Pro aminopeptidase